MFKFRDGDQMIGLYAFCRNTACLSKAASGFEII